MIGVRLLGTGVAGKGHHKSIQEEARWLQAQAGLEGAVLPGLSLARPSVP